MKIVCNGQTLEMHTDSSIQELLDTLELDCQQVVVEHNRTIVPRLRFAATALHDGDSVEVIHFVGGG